MRRIRGDGVIEGTNAAEEGRHSEEGSDILTFISKRRRSHWYKMARVSGTL